MFSFLQSNHDGGYLALGTQPESKYLGNFVWIGNDFLRIIEDILPCGRAKAESIARQGKWGIRTWDTSTQDAFWYHDNALCCAFTGESPRELFLDVKKSYDDRSWGRQYEVSTENNRILVRYLKQYQPSETDRFGEYEVFLAIAADTPDFEWTKGWVRRFYQFDAAREGQGERYVFSLCKTAAHRLVITFGNTKTRAEAELEKRLDFLTKPLRLPRASAKQDIRASATEALAGLVSRQYGRDGILAGFPWFFQYWTRDEAISARALTLIGKTAVAKRILLGLIKKIDDEGRIPNRIPAADLGCADGVGWVFLRLQELHQRGVLNAAETRQVQKALNDSLERLEAHFETGGLITNRRLETWMDTEWQGDDRSGARIEIQALTLAMRSFYADLSGCEQAKAKLHAHQEQTIRDFWHGACLCDGKGDRTIRPNLFLAYYAYPQLLERSDWEKCFDTAIEALWLSWGGFASIDRSHALFCPEYSGQNNHSYHRGDSWYFVNYLAGICLLRVNGKRYAPQIKQILSAAKKDLSELGAIGCASEVSSASQQTGGGCLDQAWSNAMLIELLEEAAKDQRE